MRIPSIARWRPDTITGRHIGQARLQALVSSMKSIRGRLSSTICRRSASWLLRSELRCRRDMGLGSARVTARDGGTAMSTPLNGATASFDPRRTRAIAVNVDTPAGLRGSRSFRPGDMFPACHV